MQVFGVESLYCSENVTRTPQKSQQLAGFSILYLGHYLGQDLFLSHFFDKCVTEILVLVGFPEWLLYNGYAPFGIKAVVLRLAVGEIAQLVGEDLRVTDLGIYIAM